VRTRSGADVWLSELVWREFYQNILWHFPFVLRMAFEPRFRDVPWRVAPHDLRAWQDGRTGYPVVDAAMRQLATTGWMHNRARMITASFLTKDLLLDWRQGEAWFMRQLVDGDPAANNGGWQWTAGTGTDAAPYFRIFNPLTQAQRFDPDGAFIRQWLPELAALDKRDIHNPATLGGLFGLPGYPRPIVDLARSRERALAAFKALDQSPDAQSA
jgi:deoxyribodipyrimidine photo-lyase